MNRSKLKSYAPAARQDFRGAVIERARKIGLEAAKVAPMEESGDYVFIDGQIFPRVVAAQRRRLEIEIGEKGFEALVDEVAYTWFNRFMAIRYMELHGYLGHGLRVLASADSGKTRPQILDEAENVVLPGLDTARVIELKLDGARDEELYKMLLLAQCRALHDAMPFLFERLDDETELLLPDHLLATDSVIRKLVTQIDESDWNEVEIIGWLYQFYISEKKDEVIGKVVRPEDIPAATQLFTPDWIVKYMVHNSLGRQWLATYPDSAVRAQLDYYVAPAAQSDAVQAQLACVTPETLEPEALTLLDPAVGSGHILTEAYDVFKAIYLERGYRPREIPRLILEKNLFGLDIDDRAAQMAGFAVLMKARADDRRILENPPRLNIRALQESGDWNAAETASALGLDANKVQALFDVFSDAKTFGSLITIPAEIAAALDDFQTRVDERRAAPRTLFAQELLDGFDALVQQARVLAQRYDAVVANPPYMGGKYLTPTLKTFLKKNFDNYEKDLFSAFIVRCLQFAKPNGYLGFMSPFVWMFISSYEKLRLKLIDEATISTLVQLEYSGFDGATVPICTFTLQNAHVPNIKSSFIKLSDFRGAENQAPKTLEAIRNRDCGWFYEAAPQDFEKIPGSPIAYWASEQTRSLFQSNQIGDFTISDGQTKSGDNGKYLRQIWEIRADEVGKNRKWIKHPKGGEFRRWYGNVDWVINWSDEARSHYRKDHVARILPEYLWGKEGFCWTLITSSSPSFRMVASDELFNLAAPTLFVKDSAFLPVCLGFVNTKIASYFLNILNPTLNMNVGEVQSLPLLSKVREDLRENITEIVTEAIQISRDDWDAFETSWDFAVNPLVASARVLASASDAAPTLSQSFAAWETRTLERRVRLRVLETENNRLFIDAYGLGDELSPDVPDAHITLARANREADARRLLSYAVGCMMGRYSLDENGLIFAGSGNAGFDASRYATFPADADGIVPITDSEYFPDDIALRGFAFLKSVWGAATFDANLQWLAESLGARAGESPAATVRRYFAADFYKAHLQTYKNRPIYWLFSSGKERAFGALVSLHRYHEGTLARLRMEYVVPLQGKLNTRSEALRTAIESVGATPAEKRRLEKERHTLEKQRTELAHFDEKLRHLADARLSLDLDDGVKVNYAKFGDLLAEVKLVTGSSAE